MRSASDDPAATRAKIDALYRKLELAEVQAKVEELRVERELLTPVELPSARNNDNISAVQAEVLVRT